jgi:hypothetical protein
MRSVAWGFARDFWGRQRLERLAILVALAYLLVLVLLVNALPAGALAPAVVGQLCIPLAFALPHLLAVFCHGDQADLAARESGYPRRCFTLPVRTAALVGWPMALGAVAVSLYWLAVAGLILRPAGVQVPLLWLAVFLVAFLAWLQALTWCPFPLPLLRIIVAVVILGTLSAFAVLGHSYQVSPNLLLAGSAALIPLGYLAAVAGVARARRGDTAVWNWPALGRHAAPAPARPFASADEALFWLEWRRNGFFLPLTVGLLLVPNTLLSFTCSSHAPWRVLVGLALYPLMMAMGAGATLGNCHPWSRRSTTPSPFLLARPITTAAVVGVKLRVALRATLLTWALILVVSLAVLPLTVAGKELARDIPRLLDDLGERGWGLLALLVLGLPALTWKCVVNQLWYHLAGRKWLTLAMALAIPMGVTALGLFYGWVVVRPESQTALRQALPWIVGGLLLLKLGLGLWVVRALLRCGIVAPRTVRRGAIAWVAAAAGLVALAFWLTQPVLDSPLLIGGLAVLLGMPLVRLALAPLALDWNRHR